VTSTFLRRSGGYAVSTYGIGVKCWRGLSAPGDIRVPRSVRLARRNEIRVARHLEICAADRGDSSVQNPTACRMSVVDVRELIGARRDRARRASQRKPDGGSASGTALI